MLIAFVIFGIFVLIVLVVTIYIKTRPENLQKEDVFGSGEIRLKIKGEFMDKQEFYYYDFMLRHIDNNRFVILPKIGMDNLLTSIGNRKQYDAISSKYVDFIIFDKKTMLPLVAIDLVEDKMSSNLTYFDKDVASALKMVKIPIYTQYVEDFYTFDDLWGKMLVKFPFLQEKKEPVIKNDEVNTKEVEDKKVDSGEINTDK